MKSEVIRPFFDLTTGLGDVPENRYYIGDVYEVPAARINELVEKGFVKKAAARKRTAKKS